MVICNFFIQVIKIFVGNPSIEISTPSSHPQKKMSTYATGLIYLECSSFRSSAKSFTTNEYEQNLKFIVLYT